MLDLAFDFVPLESAHHCVLHAYHQAEQALLAERPREVKPGEGESSEGEPDDGPIERARWVSRIGELDQVPRDRLAPIHGQLIALGFLQFQLQGRDTGVVYRLTREGRARLDAMAHRPPTGEPLRRSA